MEYKVSKIDDSNILAVKPLAAAAKTEGYNFVQRTIDEWTSGKNDFSKPGEVLWGVFDDKICIAIGGINIDPYANDIKVGRIRHLYVLPKYRRQRIARFLLKKIIGSAKGRFKVLRLSAYKTGAANLPASRLYESIGFSKSESLNQTHAMRLE